MVRAGVRAYIEHDGRVYTVHRDGRRTLPSPDEVPCPFEERGRLRLMDHEVVVGVARLKAHPTDWILKDDVPLAHDADALLQAAVLGSLFRPVVGVVAVDAGRVLLVRPSRGLATGRWTLPGGFLLPFEDPEAGARREMREETGLEPGPLTLLGAWHHASKVYQFPVLGLAYATRTTRGEIAHDPDEVAEVRWVPLEEAARTAGGMVGEGLRRFGEVARGLA